MSFEAWLLLLNLKVSSYCRSFIAPEPKCFDYVIDCVLDGEELEWCKNDFLENGSWRI